jgi:ribose-phosphate pyrophosphokinase
MDNVKIIAGRSNRPLAGKIAARLGKQLVDCVIDQFANSEINININENVRGCNIFIVQTGGNDTKNSINDFLVETLMLIDACKRADAHKVAVILPYYPYSRADKKDRRGVSIGSAVVAKILESAGADRIISMDLHAGQTQGVTSLPFDNLYGIKMHIDNLQNTLFKIPAKQESKFPKIGNFENMSNEEINEKYVLVALDVGTAKRIKEYAKRLNMKYAIMDKQRDYSKKNNVLESVLIGNVTNKICICVDDMIDTAGTLISGITDLQNHGAKSAIVLATHGILSSPADTRINNCDFIEKVIVINTLDLSEKTIPKLEIIDSSHLFAQVIERIINKGSISELFV